MVIVHVGHPPLLAYTFAQTRWETGSTRKWCYFKPYMRLISALLSMLFSHVSAGSLSESSSSQLDWDPDWSGLTLDDLNSTILQYIGHSALVHHLPQTGIDMRNTLAKSKCFLHLYLISRWIKILKSAKSHSKDFLKMRILKKKSSHCD